MNTKYLKQSFVLLLVSAIFATTSVWYISQQKKRTYGGEVVFAKTIQNLNNLGRLTIKNQGKEVNLQLEDNLWRIMEMGNYYADYNQINNLFKDFTEAKVYRRRGLATPEDKKKFGLEENALRIITRDKQEQVLNDVIIGQSTTNGLYHFAQISSEPNIFLISGKLKFPKQIYSWLKQPILSFSPQEISSLRIKNTTAVRKNPLLDFTIKGTTKATNIKSYLGALIYVPAYDVRRAADFDEKDWPQQNHLQLTTFDGLVMDISIFSNNNEYWAALKISATRLPKASTNDYIKDNAFLYDGWYFKLDKTIGETLLNAFIVQ